MVVREQRGRKKYQNKCHVFGVGIGDGPDGGVSSSSGSVVGTFFRRADRPKGRKSDRLRLLRCDGCDTPERLLCNRRSAGPFSSIEKSKPVPGPDV